MTPLEAATNRLCVAWERWDQECVRRTPADWVPSLKPGARGPRPVNLPSSTTTLRMEAACVEMAGLLRIEATAFRRLLIENMKDGASYRRAIDLVLSGLDSRS